MDQSPAPVARLAAPVQEEENPLVFPHNIEYSENEQPDDIFKVDSSQSQELPREWLVDGKKI